MLRWRYAPPYDGYNAALAPGSAEEAEAVSRCLDPALRFVALHSGGALIGFASFGEDGRVTGGAYEEDALDIGLGLRPDLTGRGIGARVIARVIEHALMTWQPAALRVTIAAFNTRAQRAWARAGFVERSQFVTSDGRAFVIRLRKGSA